MMPAPTGAVHFTSGETCSGDSPKRAEVAEKDSGVLRPIGLNSQELTFQVSPELFPQVGSDQPDPVKDMFRHLKPL